MMNPAVSLRHLPSLASTLLALGVWVMPGAAQPPRLTIDTLLDQYASGQHDAAVKTVSRLSAPQARALRGSFVSTGHRWLHAAPDDMAHRTILAAAFALEFETVRAEKGEWSAFTSDQCGGRCLIEWACTVLQTRGDADEAERLWYRATFSLVGGVRDWTFLLTPLTPPTPRTRLSGHVLHALTRLPDDPHVRLARAVAIASRYIIADELDAPRANVRSATALRPVPPAVVELLANRTQTALDFALQQFAALFDEPAVGAEARMRLGYLHFRSGQYEQALSAELAAATSAADPDLKYIANFIAAQAAQASGDLTAAEDLYGKALQVRPFSQSATIALSALLFMRGDASVGYAAIEKSRMERPTDNDPWRLFLYGDFPRLPAVTAELRKRVTR